MATPCFSVRTRYRPVLEHHFAHLLLDASTLCGYICERHVVLAEKGRGHIAPVAGVAFPLIEYQV